MDHEEDILGGHVVGGRSVIKDNLDRERAQAKVDENSHPGLPKIIDGFSAWTTNDDRGMPAELIGYYLTHAEATTVASGRGYYGGDGRVLTERLLRLEQQLGWTSPVYYAIKGDGPVRIGVDLITDRKQFLVAARIKAAASLSPAERTALGLDF